MAVPCSTEIAIAGIGVVSPFGLGMDCFHSALKSGKSSIKQIYRFPVKKWCPSTLGAFVPEFDLEELTGIPQKTRRLAPISKLALAAAHLALDDSEIPLNEELAKNTGIFVGLSRFIMDQAEYFLQSIFSGKVHELLPIRPESLHPHGPAVQLSQRYGITGPTITFPGSCVSGIHALETARMYLSTRRINLAIVISTDSLSNFQFHMEGASGILSSVKVPGFAPRPFDQKADGCVLSEGSVALILARQEDIKKQGPKMWGLITGSNSLIEHRLLPYQANEAYDFSVIMNKLFSGLKQNDIDMITTDARGIPALDLAQSIGIRNAFEDNNKIPITSIQGHTGHAGGTSALFNIVSSILAMNSSQVPQILNLEQPPKEYNLNYVIKKPLKANVNKAAVLTHGWGGHHKAIFLRKKE